MMQSYFWLAVMGAAAFVAMFAGTSAYAVPPDDTELAWAAQWAGAKFDAADPGTETAPFGRANLDPVFSFTYDGRKSAELISSWKIERSKRDVPGGIVEYTTVYTDPATGLVVRCVGKRYSEVPGIEWVLYFKNTGTKDTPILDAILPLDAGFAFGRDKSAWLHYANGSECRLEDFAPQTAPLGPNSNDPQGPWIGEGNPVHLESRSGRSSCGRLPFFNTDMGTHGVIGAVGWTGDWGADFYRTDAELRMRAGMKRTHFKLLPGEEVRSPRILLVFWKGDRQRGQNLLRRTMLAHYAPMQDGKPAQAPVCLATWGGNFAAKHIEHGRWWKDNNLPLEYLWVDAGWFGNDEAKEGANVFNSQWGRFVGDWYANPGYFPNGLNEVGAALKTMNIKFLLWLEVERVFKGSAWSKEHPEYLLGPVGDNSLYNLGNPDARRALTDHLNTLIQEGQIACYRQDFNMDPRPYWDAADAPDRVGITEIRHITGMYEMWDELLAKNPGLLIDNCSSGGRRIDIETASRSIPLWRSDVQCWPAFNTTAMQGQTQGLGAWVPLSTGCSDREDTYVFRSALGPGIVLTMADFEKDTSKHFSVDWLRAMLDQLNAVRPYFLGDFYPLLSFSLEEDAWAAWQYDRPDLGEGMVLALRRAQSPFAAISAKLRGLVSEAEYELRDLDTGETRTVAGAELMQKGFTITIEQNSGSKLIVYKKK